MHDADVLRAAAAAMKDHDDLVPGAFKLGSHVLAVEAMAGRIEQDAAEHGDPVPATAGLYTRDEVAAAIDQAGGAVANNSEGLSAVKGRILEHLYPDEITAPGGVMVLGTEGDPEIEQTLRSLVGGRARVDVSDVDGPLAGFQIRDEDGYRELVCTTCRVASKVERLGKVCDVDDGDPMDTLVRLCLNHEHEDPSA